MINLEKISVNQILTIFNLLENSSLPKKSLINKQYVRSAINFEDTLNFLKMIDLIKIIGDEIFVNQKHKFEVNNKKNKEALISLIIEKLIYQENEFTKQIIDFLGLFRFNGGKYVSLQNMKQRLKYSGLRNFLIDLDFLYMFEGKYIVKEGYLLGANSTWELSDKAFRNILKLKEELGELAELEVIKYEKRRLCKFPSLLELMEHTAKKNVYAGYDIRSFELLSKENININRYIEVKAVSLIDYKFFWSRNEINKAKLFRDQYYLYLLPVTYNRGFNIEGLKIIKNPIIEIYNQNHGWKRTEELLSFSLSM